MERTEYKRYSVIARGRNSERRVDTFKPGRAGVHLPSEALHRMILF